MPSCSRALAVASVRRCLILAVSVSLLSSDLWAAETPGTGTAGDETATPTAAVRPAPRQHHTAARQSLDERVRLFARNYDLNESQQAEVKKILEQRQQETLQIRADPSINGDARIERFRALQVTTVERIRAVLTEEQRKKYNPLAPQQIPKAEGQRSVEDWLKLTTPH